MMNSARLSRPFQVLTWSLAVAVVSIVIVIMLVSREPIKEISPFEGILISSMMVSGLTFYVSLGILAKRLGRRWIVWVGLTFITKPIGPFVAYFRMRCLVNRAAQFSSSEAN
jgi:hypothetical protein